MYITFCSIYLDPSPVWRSCICTQSLHTVSRHFISVGFWSSIRIDRRSTEEYRQSIGAEAKLWCICRAFGSGPAAGPTIDANMRRLIGVTMSTVGS